MEKWTDVDKLFPETRMCTRLKLNLTLICFEQLRMLLELYAEEKYFLVVSQLQTEFEVFVSFKVRYNGVSIVSRISNILNSSSYRKELQVFQFFEVCGSSTGFIRIGADQMMSSPRLSEAWSNWMIGLTIL